MLYLVWQELPHNMATEVLNSTFLFRLNISNKLDFCALKSARTQSLFVISYFTKHHTNTQANEIRQIFSNLTTKTLHQIFCSVGNIENKLASAGITDSYKIFKNLADIGNSFTRARGQ